MRAIFSSTRARLTGVASIATAAAYYDDTMHRGGVVNRTLWTVYAAAGTLVDYKIMYTYTDEPLDSIHLRVAQRWLACVKANGGLFSKLAQNVASMNHVLPKPILETLAVIQDRAPTVPYPEIVQLFKEEFGKSPDEMFDDFEHDSIASASIAQVHRAKIKGTDQQVAVKVQKPMIAKQMEADLMLYQICAYLIDTLFGLPLLWSVGYTCRQLRQEVDFENEARNGTRAWELADPAVKSFISVPKVYKDYSSKRVMTCEWVDAVKISDAKAIASMGFSPKEVIEVVTKFFSHQLFISGHLHADPHPGNILVRRLNGKLNIVVIDHGELPDLFRVQYAQLWHSLITGDTDKVKELAQGWGIRDSELFASFQLFRPYKGRATNPTIPTKVTRQELMELQRQAKDRVINMLSDSSKVPPELSLVGRHLNLIRSLNKGLDSPVNRPMVMAKYAHRGALDLEKEMWINRVSFEVRLSAMDLVYQTVELWRWLNRVVLGKSVGGFEDVLESQMVAAVKGKLQLEEYNGPG